MLTLLLLAQVATPGEPLAGAALVYGPRERCVLLVGGDADGARPLLRLDQGAWKPIPGSELPSRSLAAVAADAEGNLLLHGGSVRERQADGTTDYRVRGDTWRWDGKAWSCVATDGPAPRDHHGMVFDARHRTFLLFGGSDADPDGRSVLYGDTWEWRDGRWELVAEEGPRPGAHLALAHDTVRGRTVLVGGRGDDRTWEWDGTSWQALTRGPPASRVSPRLAWDPKAQRVLLFGGSAGASHPADTWAWDGERWSVVATSGPPGRTVHALAFDEARGVAVLFGGADGASVLGDLWELDGARWTRLGR
ncbi:MAG TPA: WD40 repeat domain-containing protein [Planctomycetota bacterium]